MIDLASSFKVKALIAFVCVLVACKPPKPKQAESKPLTLGPDEKKGYVETAFGELELIYRPGDDRQIVMVQGDMGFDRSRIASEPNTGLHAAGFLDMAYLWPMGRIPYRFDVTTEQAKAIGAVSVQDFQNHMIAAMRVWEKDLSADPTGFHFEPAAAGDKFLALIKVDPSTEGGSVYPVGRGSGATLVTMGKNSLIEGISVHEMGHVIGLVHEQMRPDRDQYIRINWSNIREAGKTQYAALIVGHLLTPYDQKSKMHYSPWTFSNGGPTFEFLDGSAFNSAQETPSAGDYEGVKKLYGISKSSFVDTGSLVTKGLQYISSADSQTPSYLKIDDAPNVDYYRYEITPALEHTGPNVLVDGEEVAIAGFLYEGALYTDTLKAQAYHAKIWPCTVPQRSTDPTKPCGAETTLPFIAASSSDAAARSARIQFAVLKANWNSAYHDVYSAIAELGKQAASCSLVRRGDVATYAIGLKNSHNLNINDQAIRALLSESRIPKPETFGSLGGANLALAPKIGAPDIGGRVPADPLVPRINVEDGVVGVRPRDLSGGRDVAGASGIGELRQGGVVPVEPVTLRAASSGSEAADFPAQSSSFFSRHRGKIATLAVLGTGVAVGLPFLVDELTKEASDGGSAEQSSDTGPTLEECEHLASSRKRFEDSLTAIVARIVSFEEKIAAAQAEFNH